jgi:hypothetical protein
LTAPVIADTGGLLRALARSAGGGPSFPEYENVLTSASLVIVPGLVLAEVDYFLRKERVATRKLIAEIFDPATRYTQAILRQHNLTVNPNAGLRPCAQYRGTPEQAIVQANASI